MKKINLLLPVLCAFLLIGCSKEPSLQSYMVDNQEKPDFLSVDLPMSILELDESNLSAEEKEAIESINKFNILAFKANAQNKAKYKEELLKVKTILDDSKYNELIRGSFGDKGSIKIKIEGDTKTLDELVFFGNSNEKGFAILRVLGDNMSAKKLIKISEIVDKTDMSKNTKLKEVMDFFE